MLQHKRTWSVIATLVALALVMLACGDTGTSSSSPGGSTSGSAAPTTTAKPTSTPKPKSWVTIEHFSGSQDQQTATFHLPDGARIVWTANPTDTTANIFSVEMDNSSDSTLIDFVANTANITSKQSSTYNVHGDADVFLKITTDSVDYTVDVQVYK